MKLPAQGFNAVIWRTRSKISICKNALPICLPQLGDASVGSPHVHWAKLHQRKNPITTIVAIGSDVFTCLFCHCTPCLISFFRQINIEMREKSENWGLSFNKPSLNFYWPEFKSPPNKDLAFNQLLEDRTGSSVTEGVREGVNNGWMKRERWCTSDELTCLQATQLLLVLQESERWQVLFFVLFLSLTCYNCLCRDISGCRMAAEASFSLLFSDAILRRWKCTSLMQQRRHKQRDWRSELFKCCSKHSVCVLARQRLITVTWCFRHYCIYHNNL